MLTLGIVGGIAVDLQKRYVYPKNIQDVYDGPDHIWPDRYVFEFNGHSGQVFDDGNGGTYQVPIITTKNSRLWDYDYVESGDHGWFHVTKESEKVIIIVDEGEDPSYLFRYQSTTDSNISKTAGQTGQTYTETIISQTVGTAVEVPFSISSNANWLSASDDGNNVTITVQQNDTTSERTGKITFTQQSSGQTLTFTVTQPGKEVEPEPEEPVYVFKWSGLSGDKYEAPIEATGTGSTVTVSGLISTKDGEFQEYDFDGGYPEWVHLKKLSGTTFTYTVDVNTGEESRTADITLTQKESGLKLHLVITQEGKEHIPVYVFTWENGTTEDKTVSVGSDMSQNNNEIVISTKDGQPHGYDVETNQEWIKAVISDNGINYTIEENTETE